MPTFTLDGKELTVEQGTTVLKAALANGVQIPHFCFHPHLSVDGSCRMCQVEVEKMPKLAISCDTLVADGMVVKTTSEKVLKARNAVMEYLLLNHPLDCPICDQAGECGLQEYNFKHGNTHSRFSEGKRPGRKRFEIGPRVVFDEERCIFCRRCVRFCNEVSQTGELAVFSRGDKSVLDTYPGKPLDNRYSLNTVDICPVGALTSTDFRFKVRVWFLEQTDSVCPGCSNNCSIHIDHRKGKIQRLRPRENLKVNQAWMCDAGRELYKQTGSDNRLTAPRVLAEGQSTEVTWEEAFAAAAKGLARFENDHIAAIGFAGATNEECYIFHKLITNVVGTIQLDLISPLWEADELLIKEEQSANPQGARELGLTVNRKSFVSGLMRAIEKEKLKALYLVGSEILGDPDTRDGILKTLAKLEFLLVQDTHATDLTAIAHVTFPALTFAEKEGTFTNIHGIVQRLNPAVPPVGQSKPDLEIFGGLAEAMGKPFDTVEPKKVMDELAQCIEPFRGISYDTLGDAGHCIGSSNGL